MGLHPPLMKVLINFVHSLLCNHNVCGFCVNRCELVFVGLYHVNGFGDPRKNRVSTILSRGDFNLAPKLAKPFRFH